MSKSEKWDAERIPDQSGRTFVITGASSGLGLEAAKALSAKGARVVLAVRNIAKGEAAVKTITAPRGLLEVQELDVADLSSVRRFAQEWRGDLAVLINNAGVMNVPEGRTKDGFEVTLATNYLGPFALTNLLLPHITDRVVSLSSNGHRIPKSTHIDFANLNLDGDYDPMRAYSQSKLAVLMFSLELQRRLTAHSSTVRSYAAHPGWSRTNLTAADTNPIRRASIRMMNAFIGQDAAQGVLPTLYAATMPGLPGGSYYGPDGADERRGAPAIAKVSDTARNPETAARLWDLSETLTGVNWPAQLPPRTA